MYSLVVFEEPFESVYESCCIGDRRGLVIVALGGGSLNELIRVALGGKG